MMRKGIKICKMSPAELYAWATANNLARDGDVISIGRGFFFRSDGENLIIQHDGKG
jgi:hypothetical protein